MGKTWSSISNAANWALTLSDSVFKIGEKMPESAKNRLPGFLGLSSDDEQIYAGLRTQLEDWEDANIQKLEKEMNSHNDYESNRFRLVVAGIPNQISSEKVTDKNGNIKESSVARFMGVEFLKKMAKLVEDEGAEKARERCLNSGIILRNPVQQKMLDIWRWQVNFIKSCLKKAGVESINDLGPEKAKEILEAADEKLAKPVADFFQVDEYFRKRSQRGWLGKFAGLNIPPIMPLIFAPIMKWIRRR